MAESSFPFDAGAGSAVLEDGWAQMARLWNRSGVVVPEWSGAPSGLSVGSFNSCKVSLGTGLQVVVGQGDAVVKSFYYTNTANKNLTVAANASGNPRIDLVVLELDRVNNQILAKIVQGTPAASPVSPTLTQVYGGIWQHLLCQYTVVNAATAPSALTDLRTASSLPDLQDFCYTFKTASQVIANSTPTKATWGNGVNGNSNFFASNQFTVPFYGWWWIEAVMYIPTTTSLTAVDSELVLNNVGSGMFARSTATHQVNGFWVANPKTLSIRVPGDIVSCTVTPFGAAVTPDTSSKFTIKYVPFGV